MKRNLVLLLALSVLLHPCLVSAKSLFGSGGTQVVYRGTVTGLRISAVDGTAFLDNLPSAVTDLVTASPGVYGIEVYDSSGRMLKGVAKAVGTGETLDTELVANGDMETGDPPTGWNNADGASTLARESTIKNGGSYSLKITRGTFGSSYQGVTTAAGSLYKIIKNGYRSTAGGATNTYLFGSTSTWSNQGWFESVSVNTPDTWVNTTLYKTSPQNSLYIVVGISGTTGNYGYIDDVSVQKVLTPSTAGVTIVSAKGGTTYNWSYKNANFTYNASSYYVVVKKLKGESIVKSGTGSGTTFVRGDFTSTNAFIEVVGVDLSAYVGTDAGSTPYKIRLFDSGGRIAEGYIGAGGGGETVGSERFRDATFDDTTKWTKGAGWAVSGGVATKTAGSDSLLTDAGAGASTVGQLIKRGIEISSVSAGVVYYPYDQTGSMLSYPTQSAGQYYKYWTSTGTAGVDSIYATALSDAVLLSASVKQVLDPPAATSGGLHITSANNGTTRNWKTVGSGFLYNSIASYQIIKE